MTSASDPRESTLAALIVELARTEVNQAEAKKLMKETTDDLVQDMIDVLTSMCARLYGRRSAKNRAKKAVAAMQEPDAQGAEARA